MWNPTDSVSVDQSTPTNGGGDERVREGDEDRGKKREENNWMGTD